MFWFFILEFVSSLYMARQTLSLARQTERNFKNSDADSDDVSSVVGAPAIFAPCCGSPFQ